VGYIIGLLGYTKVCSRWVPRTLTQEKKQKRVEICEELLKRYREEEDQFLLNIVTGDESWIHHFDLEEKRLSMEYRHTSSPHPKKFKTVLSAGKNLLTVFWDSQRVYVTEFLEAGKTVNSARYIETIKNLRWRVCQVRGSASRILFLHDNARPHTARATIDALETLKFEVLSHPPYSPDLVPSDFHFFPHLRRDLKGTHFTSDDEVKQAVTSWIKQRTPEFFNVGIRKLVLGWEKCIERQGDYVEKYVCQFVAKMLYFISYFRLFKYMVSFPRYFTVCIIYQPHLVNVSNKILDVYSI
jgi:histone-lysine N-methyltransferase SETMAR